MNFKSPVRDPVDCGELACPACIEPVEVSAVEGPKPPVSAKAPAVVGSVKIYLTRQGVGLAVVLNGF